MADRTVSVRLQAVVAGYLASIRTAGKATEDFATKNRAQMETVGRGLLGVGAAAIGGLGVATKAAIDWETAWAGVTKTVDGSAKQLATLEGELREMAKSLPASHQEIAAVAEAAGQLGVGVDDVADFTRTMIDLGETTNLTADQAAVNIARFSNIMGTATDDVDRLGAVLVDLGNNSETTEAEILEFSTRLAAAGNIAGLSESDVLAFGAALTSVGVEAEAGGTALSKTFIQIRDAVLTGGDQLDTFARVAGTTADDFAAAFREDPATAITMFIEGLGRMNAAGQSTTGVFEELELTDQRLMRALLSTAAAEGLLADSLDLASVAWEENTALTEEAQRRYETAAAQISMAWNSVKDAAIEVGSVVAPIVADIAGLIGSLADAFGALPAGVDIAVASLLGLVGAASALGGAFLLFAPRIVETKAAVETLGLTSGRSGKAVRGLGRAAVFAGKGLAALLIADQINRLFGEGEDDLRRYAEQLEAAAGSDDLQAKIRATKEEIERLNAITEDVANIDMGPLANVWLTFDGNVLQAADRSDFLKERLKELEHQQEVQALESQNGAGALDQFGGELDASGDAADSAASKLEEYESRAKSLSQGLMLLSGIRRNSIRAELDFESTVADTSRALVEAEQAVADARASAGDAARDSAEAERQAAQRVADAQERVGEARESAARAAEQAAERVADAEDRLADAQGQARIAQESLTQARRDAVIALADMREQVSDLALSEEAAEIGLIEARQRLEEVQQDPEATELDMRKAILAVAQAEDRLSDVRRDQKKATDELNDAEKRGVEGSAQVVTAKENIAKANETVREAQEAVRDAVEEERRTQEESSKAIREAIAGVDEARRQAARTAEESAAKIADANRRVREAEENANAVRELVRERLLDIAEAAEAHALALFKETGDQEKATEALERGRRELIEAGEQYGLTRDEAEDYADQILGTPEEWTTLFKQEGLDNVRDKVMDLADKIIELEDRTITITANGSVFVDGKRAGGRLAQGGPIDGPGTATSDSIPVWASDGEYMMRAAARRKYGDHIMDAINSGDLAIGGPASNTVQVNAEDNINAADFGLMAARIAGMAAEAGFSSGKVLPSGSYRIGRGTAGHGYPALDLPAPIGTPIRSMAAGIVSRAMRLATSYGIHAFVDHPGERQSRYAHMSSMIVGLGDEVRKGQLLGRVGSTGNSTGPHLHFEELVNGLRRDPKRLGIFHRGGPTDDEIGVLKRGEFVVQAPAVQQLGMDAMRQINQGQMPGGGGMVVQGPLIGEVKTLSGDRFSLPELENDLRFSGAA